MLAGFTARPSLFRARAGSLRPIVRLSGIRWGSPVGRSCLWNTLFRPLRRAATILRKQGRAAQHVSRAGGERVHTCKVPTTALDDWLTKYPSVKARYGHLLLEGAGGNKNLVKALRPYFESAHLDGREYFHRAAGIELHPDGKKRGAHAKYPNCLPKEAIHGLFGEVMAGLLTEYCRDQFVGGHDWTVPIFLFRYHRDVEEYMHVLSRDKARARMVFGRTGTDFVAIALNDKGEIARCLAGEAKWRKTLTPTEVEDLLLGERVKDAAGNTRRRRGIWPQLNKDVDAPHGLRQLAELLKARDPAGWSAAIFSIERALWLDNDVRLPRTNLVLLAGNGAKRRGKGDPLIDWQLTPAEYKARHDLQVVELILSDGESLISDIYDSLWRGA